jgi:predicted lipoprotein with Yx(FWY)xxD motif
MRTQAGARLPTMLLIAAALAGVAAIVVAIRARPAHAATSTVATVRLGNSSLGRMLVDSSGRTLYLFEKDKTGHSSCTGACASYWPPLLTTGKPHAGTGVKQTLLGTTKRANGKLQVTYRGHPLYRFALDKKAGQTKGEGLNNFGAEWYVVSAAGTKIEDEDTGGGGGYPGGGYGG